MLSLKAWLGPTGSCGIDVVRFSGIAEVFGMLGIFGEECSESECRIEIGILPDIKIMPLECFVSVKMLC